MPSPNEKQSADLAQAPSPLNFANALTSIRILAIPGIVFLLYGDPTPWNQLWAAALFGTAFWTDLFDGMVARRTGTITRLGKIMDPMADKLLVLAALLMLVDMGRVDVIIAILLLGREVSVSALRSLAGNDRIMIPSIMSGKLKAFAEGFGIGFVMFGPEWKFFGLPWTEIGHVLIYVALGLALWSASVYFRTYYFGQSNDDTP